MGGKAFSELLPADAFPRLPPSTYERLRVKHQAVLESLFALVATPTEAPEKPDHGDIDFIVLGRAGDPYPTSQAVTTALGAASCIPRSGNQTSHFAILLEEGANQYYQVDVHVCEDRHEWDSIVFFHGYGDLGMILGLLARSVGLSLGTKGLKIVNPDADETRPESFHLSNDFSAILDFFGLSMARWREGFSTQREVFDWVTSSRFFDPSRTSDPKKREKTRRDRGMYQAFLEYAHSDEVLPVFSRLPISIDAARADALNVFGRVVEYNALVEDRRERKELKAKFNGTLVIEWTGLSGPAVRYIMQGVKERFSVEEIMGMEETVLKAAVLEEQLRQAKKNLGLVNEGSQ